MRNLLKRIFAPASPPAPFSYRIETFPAAEAIQRPGAITSILEGKLDGFVVPDFLSSAECAHLIAGFRALQEQELVRVDAGFVSHPMAFAQMDQGVARGTLTAQEYFQSATTFRQGFHTQFGTDLERKLIHLLELLGTGMQASVPVDADGHGSFIPFTFRELLPGKGTLKAHCEHLFFQEFPNFFQRFAHFTRHEKQLSFFVVLQKPGEGGALTLYDLIWEDGQRRSSDFDIRLTNGHQVNVDDPERLPQQRISPGAGALVVFAGGKIWHRVDVVEAPPARVTVGGFLSFSPDFKQIYLWS